MKFLGLEDVFGFLPRVVRRPRWARSKYQPHQNQREAMRRLRQIEKGELLMSGTNEVRARMFHDAQDHGVSVESLAETIFKEAA